LRDAEVLSSGNPKKMVRRAKNKLLGRFARKAKDPALIHSVATKETATERIFLLKDLAAVEEAVVLGAKIVEGEIIF
jgi:hypothetical protein